MSGWTYQFRARDDQPWTTSGGREEGPGEAAALAALLLLKANEGGLPVQVRLHFAGPDE